MPKLTKTLQIVKIAADGAMASPSLGEGRFVPWVILDCREHLDITDLIKMHEDSPPGDVYSEWGLPILANKCVFLALKFSLPAELSFTIQFDLPKHLNLLDLVIHSRGVYLQSGQPGDRVSDDIDSVKIIVEIPDEGFSKTWNRIALSILNKRYKRKGLSNAEAKKAAGDYLSNLRMLTRGPMRH